MIYDILFAIVGIGLIALSLSLFSLGDRVDCWVMEVVRHVELMNDLDDKRFEDSCRLAKAFERIQALEEKIKALEDKASEFPDPEDEGIVI